MDTFALLRRERRGSDALLRNVKCLRAVRNSLCVKILSILLRVYVRICGTMSLFTGIGRTLAAFEFCSNTKFYESKRRLVLFTDECKNGTRAIDDEGDASGTTFERELTRQQSVRTTDRKVALHTNFLRDIFSETKFYILAPTKDLKAVLDLLLFL